MANPQFESLRIRQKYWRQESTELLRSLLPRGPIWHIDLPEEVYIIPIGIPSEEAFGLINITTGNTNVSVESITSEEAFGLPIVSV